MQMDPLADLTDLTSAQRGAKTAQSSEPPKSPALREGTSGLRALSKGSG
jgi:hypothetical protein